MIWSCWLHKKRRLIILFIIFISVCLVSECFLCSVFNCCLYIDRVHCCSFLTVIVVLWISLLGVCTGADASTHLITWTSSNPFSNHSGSSSLYLSISNLDSRFSITWPSKSSVGDHVWGLTNPWMSYKWGGVNLIKYLRSVFAWFTHLCFLINPQSPISLFCTIGGNTGLQYYFNLFFYIYIITFLQLLCLKSL